MRHLALLYYVLSFTAGCISIGLCLLIYRQYRKTVLRDYAVFLAALALILFGLILHLYGQLAGLEELRSGGFGALRRRWTAAARCCFSGRRRSFSTVF
jgi:hypothetical protein